MAVALLEQGYKEAWLVDAVEANDTDRVVHLLELGICPTEESLVDYAVTAGNWVMAALLRKHGAPINAQAADLCGLIQRSAWDRWRIAIWEFVRTFDQLTDLVDVRPLRKWAFVRRWLRVRVVVLYWQHVTAMPGSKGVLRAAKRFKAAAIAM